MDRPTENRMAIEAVYEYGGLAFHLIAEPAPVGDGPPAYWLPIALPLLPDGTDSPEPDLDLAFGVAATAAGALELMRAAIRARVDALAGGGELDRLRALSDLRARWRGRGPEQR
jgi:hypothetical protein